MFRVTKWPGFNGISWFLDEVHNFSASINARHEKSYKISVVLFTEKCDVHDQGAIWWWSGDIVKQRSKLVKACWAESMV